MKRNLFVRILAALGGVTLWMLGLFALAETFFHIPLTEHLAELLNARTPLAVLVTLTLAIALCAFGVCGLMMLSGKRAAKRKGFVMQKGENGAIGVSIKSIEGLVQTCVRQHDVVSGARIAVVEHRDGIVILLDIQEAAGVNIPLAVGALQKQIKQYVGECTGVDVHEVRVMVENTEETAAASPYAVKEPVVLTTAVTAAERRRETAAEEAAQAQMPAEFAPVPEMPAESTERFVPAEEEEVSAQPEAVPEEAPVPEVQTVVLPEMQDLPEEIDDRPLHQRIFGAEEQPVFVPAPPALVNEPAEAAQEIPEAEEEAPAEEETEPAEDESGLDAAEAVPEEPFSLMDEIASAGEALLEDDEEIADAGTEDSEDAEKTINE